MVGSGDCRPVRVARPWLALLMGVVVGSVVPAASQPALFPPPAAPGSRPGLKGVTAPLYVAGEPKAVAVLRVEKVFTDYQRKGFFRIGLLPLCVAEGVRLEVQRPEKAAAALANVRGHLRLAKGNVPAELRRLVVEVAGEPTVQLKAGRVRFAEAGDWLLDGGVSCAQGTTVAEGARATLQVTGESPGQLVLETAAGQRTMRLFPTPPRAPSGRATARRDLRFAIWFRSLSVAPFPLTPALSPDGEEGEFSVVGRAVPSAPKTPWKTRFAARTGARALPRKCSPSHRLLCNPEIGG